MTTQDPELSAALGWPGGIGDPVLDRAQLLQMVAALRLASQQALEALDVASSCLDGYYIPRGMTTLPEIEAASIALRAALAQEQAEPEQEPVARECSDPMCACRGGPCAECEEGQREKEIEDLRSSLDFYQRRCEALQSWQSKMRDPERTIVCDILANGFTLDPAFAGDRYTAPPKAEPAQEPGAWVASKDGRVIYDDVSADDGLLRVSGDFENDEQRLRYAQRIVDALNAAPPKAEPAQDQRCRAEPLSGGNFVCDCKIGECPGRSTAAPKVEPAQEPVAWMSDSDVGFDKSEFGATPTVPLYTAPPRREMVPLTEEEIDAEWHELDGEASALFKRVIRKFARAIEKASWEKNHGQA